jgi:lipoprotein-anchoring transpeptidase ErfK/SrfK
MKTIYLTGALVSALAVAACNQAAENKASTAVAPPTNAAAPAPAGGSAAPAATPAGDQTNQNFALNNQTGHTVMTLNVSPSNEDSWGPDILGSNVLPNGETVTVTFPRAETQCLWDIRATYDDGDTTDVRGANLCEMTTVNLTPG